MKPSLIQVNKGTIGSAEPGAVAALVPEDENRRNAQRKIIGRLFHGKIHFADAEAMAGKEGSVVTPTPPALQGQPLIIAGSGDFRQQTAERLRRGVALAAKQASALRQRHLSIVLNKALFADKHTLEGDQWEAAGMAAAEGIMLGLYRFGKYKSEPSPLTLEGITILTDDDEAVRSLRRGIERGTIVAEGTILARNLANAPGNEIFPETLAAAFKASGRECGFRVTIYDERKLAAMNMGGIVGVGKGSAHPPRLVVAEYGRKTRRRKTVVIVGKGITFDSGGISIKPSANMAEMKMDMSGAAAVIGTMQTVARLRLPVHLIGLVPTAENLPGGRALKPGDILRHHNGTTSEVDNTDAEGRLVLADALSYATGFKPDAIVDLATLTGAVVVALGHFATGMLGNDPDLFRFMKESGERTFERVWELPMFEEYERLIKSDIADVKNTGGRWAGAIAAAMFLKHFVKGARWVHLDIAGTAIIEENLPYIPKGGSGVGVRLLTDFLTHFIHADQA